MARLTSIIGSEQSGDRPVLVIQNDVGNCCSPTTIVAPITSRINKKPCMPTHVMVSEVGLDKDSVVLLEQIRTIDKKRVHGAMIGHLNKLKMLEIDIAIAFSLCLEVPSSE